MRDARVVGEFIVREFIEAMGGRVAVESAPGEGSRFRFTLPVARGPQPPRGPEHGKM